MQRPALIDRDPWLEPYADAIHQRIQYTRQRRAHFTGGQSLTAFASGHLWYGVQQQDDGWILRERLPQAQAVYLLADCNKWQQDEVFAFRHINEAGDWILSLPAGMLQEGDEFRLLVCWEGGQGERLPAFAQRVVQNGNSFNAQVYTSHHDYVWRVPDFRPRAAAPLIYECHIGMALEDERVGTFSEFKEQVLPRIVSGGYNALQIMALMEHPYYGSFGYQVSNFFALSSRFGTPEAFMDLVDACHEQGVAVIMDLVHSHAVKNEVEGLSRQDGSEHLYFHGGEQGQHPAWDSRCFDYGKNETVHLLLSNCRYWLDTFNLDGFRFDGVTSMLYHHHGLGVDFDHYDRYFDDRIDKDAICYLSLANQLIHELRPHALRIAEDMSGMPGLGLSLDEGGLGFDYRLAMGIPDMWARLIDEQRDEDWNVGRIFGDLRSRREDVQTIAYAESHDQALVGDKCISFRLMDKEMYSGMSRGTDNLVVERGMALHKMIRLLTCSVGGEGYLNFMGNEFGHPEWIDFPRAGNDWSYFYARRQWHLVDDPELRYTCLAAFDRDMLACCAPLLAEHRAELLAEHIDQRWLVYRLGPVVFVFNFNDSHSFNCLRIPVPVSLPYRLELCSDDEQFDGQGRVDAAVQYPLIDAAQPSVEVYLPTRTALILKPVS